MFEQYVGIKNDKTFELIWKLQGRASHMRI